MIQLDHAISKEMEQLSSKKWNLDFNKIICFKDLGEPGIVEFPSNLTSKELADKCSCMSCGNENVINDTNRGEIICPDCGTVISHHTPDLRGVCVHSEEQLKKRVTYEPMNPGNRLLIQVKTNDRDMIRRMNENNRLSWDVKRIMIMKIEISKLQSRLHFPKNIEDETMIEIGKVFETGILQGRSALPMALALLYHSCIKNNAPIGLKDIISSYPENEQKDYQQSIRSSIQTLSKELNYKFIPKSDYSGYISKISNILGIPQTDCTRATKLFNFIKRNNVFSGDPVGYVGGCIYHVCKTSRDKNSKRITQETLAKVIQMTEVTIRKRRKNIRAILKKNELNF